MTGSHVKLVSSLTGLDSVVSVHTNNNILSCLVKYNLVRLETVILPPKLSVL